MRNIVWKYSRQRNLYLTIINFNSIVTYNSIPLWLHYAAVCFYLASFNANINCYCLINKPQVTLLYINFCVLSSSLRLCYVLPENVIFRSRIQFSFNSCKIGFKKKKKRKKFVIRANEYKTISRFNFSRFYKNDYSICVESMFSRGYSTRGYSTISWNSGKTRVLSNQVPIVPKVSNDHFYKRLSMYHLRYINSIISTQKQNSPSP